MGKIQEELKKSKEHKFTRDDENPQLLKLSIENVGLVEFCISNDSNYLKSGDKDAAPKGKYNGSSAYWFTKLKAFYESQDDNFEDIIEHCIIAVDNENSTHLNADRRGRDVARERLVQLDPQVFYECLENREFTVFNLLAERTTDDGGRCNPSFASKFCHYACMNLFEGEEAQDNFSIYDNILRKVIPVYADRYDVDVPDRRLPDYEEYCNIIDEIIERSESGISRNGFDHLLWYYHKGHPLA